MALLLTGDDAAAVRTRLRVDAERARLRAVSEHALNPTPGFRRRLHYSSNSV